MSRVLTGAFALVVGIGAINVIPSFLWCPASESVHLTACCPELDHDTDAVRAPCCEPRHNEHEDARSSEAPSSRVAPMIAVLVALAPSVEAPVSALAPRRETLARAGPTERLHARHSIYLL